MQVKHFIIHAGSGWDSDPPLGACCDHTVGSSVGRFRVGIGWRERQQEPKDVPGQLADGLLVGDDHGVTDATCADHVGNAIRISCDLERGTFELLGSISGLPGVYRYDDGNRTLLSDSVALIAAALKGRLELDPTGCIDLAVIGHPVEGRTLFRGLELLQAGVRVTYERGTSSSRRIEIPEEPRFESMDEYLEALGTAFEHAIERMDLRNGFLSLTAGLDTRAILAVLVDRGITLPAYTLAGRRSTVDSDRAASLSRRYDLKHRVVFLDDDFRAHLPELCERASLLSGGVASLSQAHEIYFYAQTQRRYLARLSGNLGNQVGRGGTEGVGMRRANARLFAPRLRRQAHQAGEGHWFDRLQGGTNRRSFRFLVQQENLYASQANYSIGHHHAAQLTPYADAAMLAIRAREPAFSRTVEGTQASRARDLKHRFFGEPIATSFQRRIVNRRGGAVADEAVNWGWRPRGGLALLGTLQGCRAFADMAATFAGLQSGPVGKLLQWTGISGYGDFHDEGLVRSPLVGELLRASLRGSGLLEGDFLDGEYVRELVLGNDGGAVTTADLGFLLDVSLAYRLFTSPSRLESLLCQNG